MTQSIDIITPEVAGSLPGLFRERIKRSPKAVAYRSCDAHTGQWLDYTWSAMGEQVARWQSALQEEGLEVGDRVAVMLQNCPEWVMLEQAALGLGLVVVPLYTNDRPDNVGYILQDSEARLLLLQDNDHWQSLCMARQLLSGLQRILSLEQIDARDEPRLSQVNAWLPAQAKSLVTLPIESDSLATIVYTSGTTGRPKGVMLSHRNILWNAHSSSRCDKFYTHDTFLSFLPLSHMFERTAGYYMPMMAGSTVAYARSIEGLADDLMTIKPTVLVTVPRIFERVRNKIQTQLEDKPALARKLFALAVAVGWRRFQHQQGKAPWHPRLLLWPLLNLLVAKKIMHKLGGRMRLAVSGGAPLSFDIAKTFIGLGLTISQGYGMTEASPVISTNRLDDNEPGSVGQALPEVEVRIADNGELLARSPGIMLGYWKHEATTQDVIDTQGWLHTGDIATIKGAHIYITGRLKDILVLATGEKVAPTDIELAIAADPLFEQVMIIGEGRPFLTALVALNSEHWDRLAEDFGFSRGDPSSLTHKDVTAHILERINQQLREFPGYAKIHGVICTLQAWDIESGLITPTLKLKRNRIMEHHAEDIDAVYAGH